jgi:hypothetical protein
VEEKRTAYRFLVEILKERSTRQSINWKIILEWLLKK